MKLQLPNSEKIYLDTKLNYEERLEVVNNILRDWEDYFYKTWNLQQSMTCLDVLSTYLCTAKEEEDKNKEDKFVLSTTKVKKMQRGNSKQVNFSDLDANRQQLFGLADFVEESETE